MKAQEMFEKLGYELNNKRLAITYEKRTENEDEYEEICFSTDIDQYYTIRNECFGTYVTLELHQAITQQIKELGWEK